MRKGKKDIDACNDIIIEDVEVPEWGGVVGVKMMSLEERDSFEASIFKDGKVDPRNLRAKLLVRTLVDDAGERLFTDDEVGVLAKKSAKAADRCFVVAQRLNGIGQVAQDEIEKN